MDCSSVPQVLHADVGRHGTTPVATLGDVGVVPEADHERIPRLCDPAHALPGLGRLPAPAVAGQGRNHEMECVVGRAAMCGRVGERVDHPHELGDGTRPAVRQHHRRCVVVRRPDVHGVNVDAVDLGEEMVVGVELSFEASPVVALGPVGAEFLGVRERDALAPIVDRFRISPAGAGETIAKIGDLAVGDTDGEGADGVAHRAMLAARWPHRNLSRRRLRTTMTLDSTFVSVLDYLGVFVFALSGAWLAIRRDLDLVGVVTLGLVTGLAGGVVRDVLVADLPPVAVREGWLLAIAGGAAIAALLVPRPDAALERLVVGLDAVGLGFRDRRGDKSGRGGRRDRRRNGRRYRLRDRRRSPARRAGGRGPPSVPRGSRLYVIPALLGSLIVGLAWEFDLEGPVTEAGGATTVIALRLLALRYGWHAPLPQRRSAA